MYLEIFIDWCKLAPKLTPLGVILSLLLQVEPQFDICFHFHRANKQIIDTTCIFLFLICDLNNCASDGRFVVHTLTGQQSYFNFRKASIILKGKHTIIYNYLHQDNFKVLSCSIVTGKRATIQ